MGQSRFAKDYAKMTNQQINSKLTETNTYVDDMIKSMSDVQDDKHETDYKNQKNNQSESNNRGTKKDMNQNFSTGNSDTKRKKASEKKADCKSENQDPYIQVGVYLTADVKKFLNHEVRRSQSSRKLYMEKLLESAFLEMDQGIEPDEDEMEEYIQQLKVKKYLVPFDMKKSYSEKFATCAALHIMKKSEFCNYLIIREMKKN